MSKGFRSFDIKKEAMVFILFLFPVLGILLWKLFINKPQVSNLPPGPKSLPLVGHMHLLAKGPPHQVLHIFAKKYGPIMSLRFGSVPVVVASGKDSAREFLKTHDTVFASRPPSSSGRFLAYNHSDVIFGFYGERWRQLRRLCALELLTVRRLESLAGVRRAEVRALVSSAFSSSRSGSTFDVRGKLTELTFNTITQMLMSKRYFGHGVEDASEAANFIHVMEEIFEVCGAFPIGDYFPYLRWLDLDGTAAWFKRLSKATDKFLEGIISEHESKRKLKLVEQGPVDFLDVLLTLRDNGENVLQGNSIKGVMINMITAGTDTSSVTIEWAMAELMTHPTLVTKVQDEIDKVVGRNRLVDEQDIPKLPYLQAVVKEAFRLHPPVPLLVPHQSMEASKVMGYDLPDKTTLLVNVYSIGRDSQVWEDPLEFRPERFYGSRLDVRGHDFELLPFGSGRRSCPGISLALSTVHVTLANLLHGFNWEIPPGQVIDTLAEKYGLTLLIAKKLEGIPRARLPIEVYP